MEHRFSPSRHDSNVLLSGVSCDACMISNFPGRRYKCLVCVNYDLCGTCYDAEAESQNHKNNHPMQCLLTDTVAGSFPYLFKDGIYI